ncbi:MAG: hypothetical protein WAU23_04930 [Ferruginibacter sp.]
MKIHHIIKLAGIACLLIPALQVRSQKAVSFDVAGIRSMRSELNGLNVSCFYHINERLTAGLEMNRFFAVTHVKEKEAFKASAWDFDLNFHYLLPVIKKIKLYPIAGISHTSEKEQTLGLEEVHIERFWSANTGAGLLVNIGKWAPHVEYLFTWGHLNQQFLLAGISYELEWGRTKKEEPDH